MPILLRDTQFIRAQARPRQSAINVYKRRLRDLVGAGSECD
jgi:hypothetical protein